MSRGTSPPQRPMPTSAPNPAGYSGTPLPQKLGLKDGQRVLFISLPPELKDLRTSRRFVEIAQAGWESFTEGDRGYDVIHGFTASRDVLEKAARPLMEQIDRDGTIWISWPKKASKVATDITEDSVRLALRKVKDPELNLNIVDLGLVYNVTVDEGNKVIVDMSLTSPGCPAGPQIMQDAERTIQAMPGVGKVVINLVWEPFWTPERIEPKVRAYMGI